jgi:lipoprotein NlpI
VLRNKGDLDAARSEYTKAQTLDSHSAYLNAGRGILEILQGAYGDAITDLERAMQVDTTDATSMVWLHLAKLHTNQDDRQELDSMRLARLPRAFTGLLADKAYSPIIESRTAFRPEARLRTRCIRVRASGRLY